MDYRIMGSLDNSFTTLWGDAMSFIPLLVVAIVVVVIGWMLGSVLKMVTESIFAKLKINELLDAAEVDALAERAGYKLKAGAFVGSLVKWFVILVFIVAALDMFGLQQVTTLIRDDLLGYLPKVIVAVFILLAGLVAANLVSKSVAAAIEATGVHNPNLFRKVTYVAIVLFAVLATLNQLDIAPELVQTLFMGIVFALSLALGLAFGLGGKDAAGKYINEMSKKGHNHHDHH